MAVVVGVCVTMSRREKRESRGRGEEAWVTPNPTSFFNRRKEKEKGNLVILPISVQFLNRIMGRGCS